MPLERKLFRPWWQVNRGHLLIDRDAHSWLGLVLVAVVVGVDGQGTVVQVKSIPRRGCDWLAIIQESKRAVKVEEEVTYQPT